MAEKLAPSVRIEGTNAQITVAFPPIGPQQFRVQWYGREYVDDKGFEVEETVDKPLPRGWGLWCQADVIAEAVRDRKGQHRSSGKGMVIGGDESLRVLGWLDETRKLANITYDPELKAV